MCPYCLRRFKSKATCRIHLQIHKTEWVRQFKEQLKSGTIQFEEDTANHSANDVPTLDVMADNDGMMETINESTSDSYNETVQNTPLDGEQVLFTDLVQGTQVDDSGNQFEYFLLLPTNSDPIGSDEQFIVNDEQLNFSNLQFIQLEQSTLLEMQNSQSQQTVPLQLDYRLNDNNSSIEERLGEMNQPINSNSVVDIGGDMSQTCKPVPDSEETTADNVNESNESNQIALTNEKSTRTRRSTKSINKCETCEKIFQKPIDLRRHIRTHTLEKV